MANTPDWLQERSAAIPLIQDAEGLKIVLVTTTPKEKDNWIFPKGHVEIGMSAHDSAAKEAYEEAGVIGRIHPTLFDQYEHQKWGGKMRVKVYTLEVQDILEHWPEMRHRNRTIVPLDQAIELVQSVQKETLIKLKQTR
ncbi:MAG: NUDIX hydrolase [Thiotrichales bacterium]|nr:NUDIX hydrolase [Thiotrichales bacterium]